MTLCAAAMAFLGLSYMYHQCKITHGWGTNKLTGSDVNSGLGPFMKDMGYDTMYLNGNKRGNDIASLLEDGGKGFDSLVQPEHHPIYYSFVDKLETQYNLQQKALDSPLTACYIFAKLYFTSQFKKPEGTRIDGTLEQIKEALKTFKSSCWSSAQDLSEQIDKFLKKAMTELSFPNPEHNTDSSSPAGPIAGTLTTLGLGGGAAAAYLFNIGGAKTLINGLLRIG
ncbi:variant erythrocyte surface antigen-1, beta subunit [Babesia caballi]|uniref:Variant erythrocyte surface antigen-1, beta subunit n=1 Tax=Babesia caballi TaxID=5871 RepID=A0AAV4M3U1_BABCB|nr:variant erythrocyte surface antigen-1, beta subunit [Babesia caballi]